MSFVHPSLTDGPSAPAVNLATSAVRIAVTGTSTTSRVLARLSRNRRTHLDSSSKMHSVTQTHVRNKKGAQMTRLQRWASVGVLLGATSSCEGGDKDSIEKISSNVTVAPVAANSGLSAPAGKVIPAGKVMVPGGRLVEKSCVFEVPDGATVNDTHDVFVSGQLLHRNVPCTPQQMGYSDGESAWQNNNKVQPPSISHSWVTYSWAWATTISGKSFYNKLNAYWEVPSKPAVAQYELLYYFPSFESNTEIVQPVLQYGYNGDFGGLGWTIAGWYCWSSGCHHSPGLGGPNPGDTINGYIQMTG